MYERNYFGMSLVEQGDADAFITGLYTKYSNTIKVAKEVIGIRPEFKTFGTMHILNTQKGVFYIADTLINRHPDEDVLTDIAKLSAHTVKFFNEEPVIAMLSYSNFGTDAAGSPVKVHKAVAEMQKVYPDLAIDGEMQVNYALNKQLRDEKYPFSRLKGKDVNTLVFPNLSSANASYKLLQALNPEAESLVLSRWVLTSLSTSPTLREACKTSSTSQPWLSSTPTWRRSRTTSSKRLFRRFSLELKKLRS